MVVSQRLVYGFKRQKKVARFDYMRCCRRCGKIFIGSKYAKVCSDCHLPGYQRGIHKVDSVGVKNGF